MISTLKFPIPKVSIDEERNDPVMSRGHLESCEVDPDQISVVSIEDLPFFQAAHAPALPQHVEFTSLRDGRIRVLDPIRVKVSRHEEMVIAHIPEIEEYGQGPSLGEAIEDLQRGLAELFLTLEDEGESLGSDLERVRQWLQSKLKAESVKPA
jgi:hypothetical protein